MIIEFFKIIWSLLFFLFLSEINVHNVNMKLQIMKNHQKQVHRCHVFPPKSGFLEKFTKAFKEQMQHLTQNCQILNNMCEIFLTVAHVFWRKMSLTEISPSNNIFFLIKHSILVCSASSPPSQALLGFFII